MTKETVSWSGCINDSFLTTLLAFEAERLILCTSGGDVHISLAAADFVFRRGTEIIVTGQCMSAGLVILASSHSRKATALTRFYNHPCSEWTPDGSSKTSDPEMKLLDRLCARILGNATDKEPEFWMDSSWDNHYFGAEEALELGLIQEIIPSCIVEDEDEVK